MDRTDADILNIIQDKFPVSERPFAEIADRVGISEDECLARVALMKEQGLIRRLGGIFDSPSMGMKSTLCAMIVPGDAIDSTVQVINEFKEVTHNYLRDHRYNIWFTVTADSESRRTDILQSIAAHTGFEVFSMPVRKAYKIKAVFKVG
ncbi:MAG: AsnC family transcriptional regulator [Candidatus Saccharibacteria bacterium]